MNLIRISSLAIILLVAVCIGGCEYKTDETYFRTVDKDVPLPDLTVDLNFNADTIYVYNYSTFKLSLNLTNKELYAVKFFVNDKENELFDQYNSHIFSFVVYMAENPVVKVRAEIYISSGTGSIADKVQAESYIYKTKEWVLIYVPEKPVLTTEAVGGRLKISWTPVKGTTNCKYYITTSSFTDSTYNNWYIDSTYYGGKSYVSVTYQEAEASGYRISTEIFYPLPKAYLNNKEAYVVTWEKCRFYNAIKGYRLRFDNETIDLGPLDTSYVYKNGTLGKMEQVQMELVKKNYNQNNSEYVYFEFLSGYYPLSFLPASTYFRITGYPLSGNTFYFWTYQNNIPVSVRYSLESRSIISSAPFGFNLLAVSPNSRYVLSQGGLNITLMNTDFMHLKTVPVDQISNFNSIQSLTVSDIGTTVIYDYLEKVLIVYDMLNEKSIVKIPVSNYVSQFKISANGEYIFEPWINELYKVEDNTYSKIWGNENIANQFGFFEFFPDNSGQIALYDGSIFYIKKCSDFSSVKTFPIENKSIVNIDFDKKMILTHKDGMLYIYSLSDGELLHSIKFYGAPSQIHLINDHIISELYQLNLNNYK